MESLFPEKRCASFSKAIDFITNRKSPGEFLFNLFNYCIVGKTTKKLISAIGVITPVANTVITRVIISIIIDVIATSVTASGVVCPW